MRKKYINALKARAIDPSLPITERIEAARKIKDLRLNPLKPEDFNPDTFEMNKDPLVELIPRKRVKPPKRLPTKGLMPKETMDGQMVGAFESKQDLYLLIAHLYDTVATLTELLEKDNIINTNNL